MSQPRRVLLLGKTGSGKSSLGNLLTGRTNSFDIGSGMFSSATTDCKKGSSEDGLWIVVDTPDITEQLDNPTAAHHLLRRARQMIDGGAFDAVLLVTRLDVRFTEEERRVIDTLMQAIGPDFGSCCLVFTHGDCVDNNEMKFRETIASSRRQMPLMGQLIDRCNDRFVMVDLSQRSPAEVSTRQLEMLRQLMHSLGPRSFSADLQPESSSGRKNKRAKSSKKNKQTGDSKRTRGRRSSGGSSKNCFKSKTDT